MCADKVRLRIAGVLLICLSTSVTSEETLSDGSQGTIRLQNDSMIIDCRGQTLQRESLLAFERPVVVSRLLAQNCSPPDVLRDEFIALNITPPTRLKLHDVASGWLSAAVFSGLHLTALSLHNATLADNALSSQNLLTELEMSYVTSPQLPHASHLQRLSLRYCLLRQIPKKLVEAEQLRSLDLSYNHIANMEINALSSSTLLTSLDLSHNALSTLVLHLAHMRALSHLNLSSNNITKFSFQELRSNVSMGVDLRNNPVKELHFTEEDYKWMLNVKTNLSVHVDPYPGLTCECMHGWLVHALNATSRLRVHDGHCSGVQHAPLQEADRISLECTYEKCVPDACSCRTAWHTGARVLRCEALTTVPRGVPGLRALLARENNVAELSSEDLPDSLLILDLSKNKITHIDNETTSALLRPRKRRVWLAGNPLACACSNVMLFHALATHKHQVFDYSGIQCYNESGAGTLLTELDTEQLCVVDEVEEKWNAGMQAAAGAVVTLVLAIVAVLLHGRYGRRILMWLRAVGWLSVRDDSHDGDSNRPYDVFVSFAHRDADLVMQELLPRLEREYRVCVHYRDWVVGEWIPAQITKSVADSKRTVIVVSRNFAASQWARLEFRSALAGAITDGVPRLAVIVLDDVVLDSTLDDDLGAYLRCNTYLKWGDPWFWHKLKVVMPRPRAGFVPPPEPDTDGDKAPALSLTPSGGPDFHQFELEAIRN